MLIKFKEFSPQIAPTAWIAPSADLIGNIQIAEESSVWFGCVLRADVNQIIIGKRSNIQDLSMIHTDLDIPAIIGDDVTIGHKVMLHGCTIGNGCLIGMSATVLDGAEIGEGSIVGANSLVTAGKKFPPHSLIMGTPAKVVKQLDTKDVEGLIHHAAHYVKYKNDFEDITVLS
ncbi:MAG: gamma carbonic anhydrase family protein [Candidatus Marinarcus sp.]|uniref:gamma carbonic anhydrase family protein n=1 Tax=Candidatus Marinarcus sp. TaxID=3100987 RepID=UPI003B009BD9